MLRSLCQFETVVPQGSRRYFQSSCHGSLFGWLRGDQALSHHVFEQASDIVFRTSGNNVVFQTNGCADVVQALTPCDLSPDLRADRVKAEIGAGLKVQDRGLAGYLRLPRYRDCPPSERSRRSSQDS